jgi:Fe2+ transport system protein FeoA
MVKITIRIKSVKVRLMKKHQNNSPGIRTLWNLKKGETCVITGFDDAMQARYKTRLTELGFRLGAGISCTVSPRLGAPKLYRVANAVYSLEKQIAELVSTENTAV